MPTNSAEGGPFLHHSSCSGRRGEGGTRHCLGDQARAGAARSARHSNVSGRRARRSSASNASRVPRSTQRQQQHQRQPCLELWVKVGVEAERAHGAVQARARPQRHLLLIKGQAHKLRAAWGRVGGRCSAGQQGWFHAQAMAVPLAPRHVPRAPRRAAPLPCACPQPHRDEVGRGVGRERALRLQRALVVFHRLLVLAHRVMARPCGWGWVQWGGWAALRAD